MQDIRSNCISSVKLITITKGGLGKHTLNREPGNFDRGTTLQDNKTIRHQSILLLLKGYMIIHYHNQGGH